VRTTVVIATRNRRERLLETLGRMPAAPMIVVDTGSSDGTAAAVRRACPDVRVVEVDQALGAGARTLGARLAATPYVAFSDDDSWWAPDALPRAEARFDADPRLGLIAARIIVEPDGRLDPTCERMRDSPLAPEVRGFVACGAVVRRDALLACGGFEPRFQFGGEEELVALDLAAAGWRLRYADDVVAHHAPADDERDGRDFRDMRNALWTAWLRRPAAAALARTRSVLADAGASAPMVLGAALRGLPWILRRRRVVPPQIERELRALGG